MRKPLMSSLVLSFTALTLSACGPQEPAAAPLAAPPPADPSHLAVTPPPAPPPAPAPPPELTPTQTVKFYQDCWAAFNSKNFDKYAACFAANAVSEQVDHEMPVLSGQDIVDKQAKLIATAFPDLVGEAQFTLTNGKTVLGVWLIQGTHQGSLSGPTGELPATNKKIGYLMAHVAEIQGGKAVKEQLYYDGRTFLAQLGVLPGPVRKVAEKGPAERPVVIAGNSPAEAQNLETYKKYIEAFNKHDAKELEPLLADDVIYSEQSSTADLIGKKEVQRGVKDVWKAMSDVRVEPKNVWVAGDYVVSASTFAGTNDGPIPSMKLWKKTGKPVSLNVLEIAKIQDNKVKHHWVFSNGLAFANQLGLTPPAKSNQPAAPASGAKAPAQPAATARAAAAAQPAAPVTPVKPAEPAKPAAPPAK